MERRNLNGPRLPGPAEGWWAGLLAWLDRIESHPSTCDEFVKWALETSSAAESEEYVHSCLRSLKTLIRRDDQCIGLTADGRSILRSKDRAELLRHSVARVRGFDDILGLDPRREYSTDDVLQYLRARGFTWRRPNQASVRLKWLVACGVAEKRGRDTWKLLEAASSLAR